MATALNSTRRNSVTYCREEKIENYLVKRVEEEGGRAYKFTSPGRRFVPDRLLALPRKRFKEPLSLVECKAPTGRIHPGQAREHAFLWALGIRVRVVHTRDEVDEILRELRRG